MTKHKPLHPRDNINKLYVSRKEGGRIHTSIKQLENNTEKRGGRLITVTRNNTDNMRINRTKITRKQKWEEKLTVQTF